MSIGLNGPQAKPNMQAQQNSPQELGKSFKQQSASKGVEEPHALKALFACDEVDAKVQNAQQTASQKAQQNKDVSIFSMNKAD